MNAPLRRIRASAGSGKTYELISRFLALLAASRQNPCGLAACALPQGGTPAQGCTWQEILAITFTNQAAAELKERIVTRLKAIALGLRTAYAGEDAPLTPESADKWLDVLLRQFGSLNVRTIDSLLHQIVRMAALELDLPPDFEPVFSDRESLLPLWNELMELSRTDREICELLEKACTELIHNPSNFKGFLAGDVLCDSTLGLAMELSLKPFPRLAEAQVLISELAGMSETVRDQAATLYALCANEHLALSKNAEKVLCACQQLTSDADAPNSRLLQYAGLDDWLLKASKGRASQQAQQTFFRLIDAVSTLAGRGSILRTALRTTPLIRLALVIAGALPDELRREGKIPQALIPLYAQKTLQSAYGVPMALCRMGTRLTHLLIDEFQDTSRDQWKALRPLVLEALARGGTLTFVGDIKQAIYGWRGGDALLFDEVGEDRELRALGELTEKPLPTNHRSRETIVKYNNTVFSRLSRTELARTILQDLLPDGTPPEVLEQEAVLLSRAFTGTEQRVSSQAEGGFIQLDELHGDTAELLNEAVHSALVDRIRTLVERRSCGDIAILVRKKDEANLVADWLLSEGFPVVTEDSFLLGEHPLVSELVALLTFLDTPDDDNTFWQLATAEFLTTEAYPSFCRLQDWLADQPERDTPLWQRFQQDFPDAWDNGLAPLFQTAALLGVYDTVSEALRHFDVLRRFPSVATFAGRFLEVLYQAENRGMSSTPVFLEYWAEHGDSEKAPMPDQLDAIRIMTMHKAKGLQFPVVLVPWLALTPLPSQIPQPYDLGDGSIVFAPMTPAWGKPYYEALSAAAREALHLLYVAWTRPEEELHAFITSTRRNSASAQALLRLLDGLPKSAGTPTAISPARTNQTVTPEPVLSLSPDTGQETPHGLPELKIFRNPLNVFSDTDDPRYRGTLAHRCLELLPVCGGTAGDIAQAVTLGMRNFPAPISQPKRTAEELDRMLHWLLSLPEAAEWLRHGTTECAIMDEHGRIFRADLVVNDGRSVTVVDYKTGERSPAHEAQLTHYMRLFAAAQPLPVSGALVYLDLRRVFRYGIIPR